MLEQVRPIFEIVGPYLNTTLEQFVITLMWDAAPEDEIVVWASISATWLDYHEQYLNGSPVPFSIPYRWTVA